MAFFNGLLGLCRAAGRSGFRLLYLWYDVPGPEGVLHAEEARRFAEAATADGVRFHAVTYQSLLGKLARECRREHPQYVRYVTERYL